MRKFVLFGAAAFVLSILPVFSGCSNTLVKKKVPESEAGAGEGSVAASSCDGGIWNYQTASCDSCPASVDAGMMGGMCPPDAGGKVYRCNLVCSDVNLSQSSIDTKKQTINVSFAKYPLAITGVTMVYFAITASAADGGFMEASSQDYPTSMKNNVLTMDLSKMPAATFASMTKILPSGLDLTDACGRPESEALDFQFTKTNGTWTASCMDGGMP